MRSLVVDAGGTRGDGIADLLRRREGAPEGEAEIVSSAVRRRIVLVEVATASSRPLQAAAISRLVK